MVSARCDATPGRGTQWYHSKQVMPRTTATGFDHIGGEPLAAAFEAIEFGSGGHTPTVFGQTGPEHVGHQHQVIVLTDGTGRGGGRTQLSGSSQQLGMCIAHLIAAQSTPVVLVDEMTAGETVVDRAHPVHRRLQRLLAERHAEAGYPGTNDLGGDPPLAPCERAHWFT